MTKSRHHSDDSKHSNNSKQSGYKDTFKIVDWNQGNGHNQKVKDVPAIAKEFNQRPLRYHSNNDLNQEK